MALSLYTGIVEGMIAIYPFQSEAQHQRVMKSFCDEQLLSAFETAIRMLEQLVLSRSGISDSIIDCLGLVKACLSYTFTEISEENAHVGVVQVIVILKNVFHS